MPQTGALTVLTLIRSSFVQVQADDPRDVVVWLDMAAARSAGLRRSFRPFSISARLRLRDRARTAAPPPSRWYVLYLLLLLRSKARRSAERTRRQQQHQV